MAELDFAGYGIGGAIEKENLATIVRWVTEELPDDRPRHLLGIGEPEDLFAAVEVGCDTFDCVGPSRVARSSRVYTPDGRENLNVAASRRNFGPIDTECDCHTCAHYTRAYLHHLFKAKEYNAATLCTIHNERFMVRLVDRMRDRHRRRHLHRLQGRLPRPLPPLRDSRAAPRACQRVHTLSGSGPLYRADQ